MRGYLLTKTVSVLSLGEIIEGFSLTSHQERNHNLQRVILVKMSFLNFICHCFCLCSFEVSLAVLYSLKSLICHRSSHSDYHPPTGPKCYQRNQSHHDLWSHTRPQRNYQVRVHSQTWRVLFGQHSGTVELLKKMLFSLFGAK